MSWMPFIMRSLDDECGMGLWLEARITCPRHD
jgi:hypothetical protein